MRVLFVTVLLLGIVLAAPAVACTCRGADSELDPLRAPTIVFRGTAVAVEPIRPAVAPTKRTAGRAATPTIRFQIDTMFKGPPERRDVAVAAEYPDGVNSCGVAIAIGDRVLVAASGDGDAGYQTNLCLMGLGRNEEPFARYREQTDALRQGLAAAPAATDRRRALAGHYFRHADWENLRDLLRDAHEADLLVLRGQADVALAKTEAALASFEHALAADPTLAEAAKGRVAALITLGRTDGFGPGSDFSGQTAQSLTLNDKDLTGSSFAGAEFMLLSVERATLSGSDFRRAKAFLSGKEARLRGADFRHARISGGLYKADAEGADFRWAVLRNLRFAKANLENADFTAADMENVDFVKARLTGVIFSGSRFESVRLPNVDLSGQSFAGGTLHGVDLSGARLSGTDLRNADLSNSIWPTRLHGADLSQALLEGTNLTGAVYDCRTLWPAGFAPQAYGAIYDAKNCGAAQPAGTGLVARHAGPFERSLGHGYGVTVLQGMDLAGQSWAGHDLRRIEFRLGTLKGTSLVGAWLDGARFVAVDLTGTDFSGTDLRDVLFVDIDVPNLILRRTVIGATAIRTLGANLVSADLAGAAIAIPPKDWPLPFNPLERGAFFLDVPQAAARFGLPDLRGADLRHRNLSQADFSGVDLSGADLSGALLDRVSFRDANLKNVTLHGAVVTQATQWPSGFDLAAAKVVHRVPQPHPAFGACGPDRRRSTLGGTVPVPNFNGATLDGINWNTTWLEGGKLAGASLRRARLECANMTSADLRKANLENASLGDATLDGAGLTGANLRNTDLRWTSLRGATLTDTDLAGALYNDDTAWPQGFDPGARGAVHR